MVKAVRWKKVGRGDMSPASVVKAQKIVLTMTILSCLAILVTISALLINCKAVAKDTEGLQTQRSHPIQASVYEQLPPPVALHYVAPDGQRFNPFNLTKRQAPTEEEERTYHNSICRGQQLIKSISLNTQEADAYLTSTGRKPSASKWKDYGVLEQYGWSRSDPGVDDDYLPSRDFLSGLGIRADSSTRKAMILRHDRDWTDPDGDLHHGTSGYYYTEMDPSQGVIYVYITRSPRSGIIRDPTLPDGPWAWSDVTFLEWQHLNWGADFDLTTDLKYVFQIDIINRDTKTVFDRVLATRGTTAAQLNSRIDQAWQYRQEFTPDTEEGQALIGTPNVYGVAWLLINHKEILGSTCHISRIILFPDSQALSLCLEIV